VHAELNLTVFSVTKHEQVILNNPGSVKFKNR